MWVKWSDEERHPSHAVCNMNWADAVGMSEQVRVTENTERSVGSPRSTKAASRACPRLEPGGAGHRRILRRAFVKAQDLLIPLSIHPQHNQYAVLVEALRGDEHDRDVELGERADEQLPHALSRPSHESARGGVLVHRFRNWVEGLPVVAGRHPGRDCHHRMGIHRIGGRRPLKARRSHLSRRTSHRKGLPRAGSVTQAPMNRGFIGAVTPDAYHCSSAIRDGLGA